jgi:type IV secretion system protein VirD4
MTLNISENSWAKAGLIIALVLAVIGVWAYLAGGIFLMAYDHKFEEATPLTLYQYWFHYGAEKQVQKWLYIASGLSLFAILSPAASVFRARETKPFR